MDLQSDDVILSVVVDLQSDDVILSGGGSTE